MHDKKVHSSPGLGRLSQLFLAWPSWTTIAVVFFLIGLHNGFWIIRNFLLLRLSAVFQSVDLCCWLVFCLGFFLWTTARMGLNVASCLFFFFSFKFIFCSGKWKVIQKDRRQEKCGSLWPQGMARGAQGCHGHAPTNYNSKVPAENFKTLSSFTDCLMNASPILSTSATPPPPLNRAGLVYQQGRVWALKTKQKVWAFLHVERTCFLFHWHAVGEDDIIPAEPIKLHRCIHCEVRMAPKTLMLCKLQFFLCLFLVFFYRTFFFSILLLCSVRQQLNQAKLLFPL